MKRRKELTILNAITSIALSGITIVIGFVSQRVFIDALGSEYLGLSNLFSNLVSVLTMADMGLSSAVVFHLYAPLAKKQHDRLRSIMNFYRRTCRIVALIIVVFGALMMPLLGTIVDNSPVGIEIHAVFLLFVANAVFSYLMNYKRALIQADQKSYMISLVHVFYVIALNSIQIAILVISQNYYAYLAIAIVARIIENLVLNKIAIKRYANIFSEPESPKIDTAAKKGIIRMMKGTAFHNVAGQITSSKDSVIISSMFGLGALGRYANYQMVFSAAATLISQVFSAITANLGSVLVEDNKGKSFEVFKKILLVNNCLVLVFSVGLFSVLSDFIKVWLGSSFELPFGFLLIFSITFYLQTIRQATITLLLAAGVVYENRFVPVMETCINVIASILCAYIFGLSGVLIGTSISMVFLHLFSYPKFAYSVALGQSKAAYVRQFILNFAIFLASLTISAVISSTVVIESPILHGAVTGMSSLLVSGMFLLAAYKSTPEFKYFSQLIKSKLNTKSQNFSRKKGNR